MFFEILYYTLTILIIIAGVFIFLSNNPVHSVLFLILTFCIASLILLMFEIEFLGLLFIMVYVGAVAVLFLFVVMMINTKKIIPKDISTSQALLLTSLLSILIIKITSFFKDIFFDAYNAQAFFKNKNLNTLFFDKLTNIEVIGQGLYNNYSIAVLLAGFVLLIALIGCVCLTIDLKKKKIIDKSYRQLSKASYNTINF